MLARSKSFRIAAICSVSLGISACGEVDPFEKQPIDWTELDDGSFFAEREEPELAHMAERCWPADAGYICIVVSQGTSAEISGRQVAIAKRTELREEAGLTTGYPDGYTCGDTYGGSTRQSIRANGREVDSRTFGGLPPGISAWTKEEIEERLARYGVEGPGYYDCLQVLLITGTVTGPTNLRTSEYLTPTELEFD